VTESEDYSCASVQKREPSATTEPERLRAEARRALILAHAINDEKTTKNLEAYAAELLARADALDEREDEN
jgi:hypothetical protein